MQNKIDVRANGAALSPALIRRCALEFESVMAVVMRDDAKVALSLPQAAALENSGLLVTTRNIKQPFALSRELTICGWPADIDSTLPDDEVEFRIDGKPAVHLRGLAVPAGYR